MASTNEVSKNYRAPLFIDITTTVDAKTGLGLNVPFSYREHPENRLYTVREGDTWSTIAFKAYGNISASVPDYSPARLYWVIANFQPIPSLDPFVVLRPGLVLVIPGRGLLTSEILGG